MDTKTMRGRGAPAEWARCLSLLGSGRSAIWLFIGLSFTSIDLWGLYAFFMVLMCGVAAEGRQRTIVDRLSYLEALPIRASSRTLVEIPEIAMSGLFIAGAARWHHFAPWSALTLWGCCAWAIATSHFFPIRRWSRVPVWILIICAAPFVCMIAFGPDGGDPSWKRAAIASVVMAGLGLALSPRSIRRPLARPTTQIVAGAAWPPARSAAPSFRPANSDVGFGQLFGFGVPHHNQWVLWLIAIGSLTLAPVILSSGVATMPNVSWMMMPYAMIPFVAAATSPRTIDFLGSRPLRLRRIVATTVLPWFLCALLAPLVAVLRELAAPSRSHEISARMALLALTFLFLGGIEPPRGGSLTRRAMAWVGPLSPLALMLGMILTTPPFGILPNPPFWSVAALAVVSAVSWYLRLPWRRLSITS
ncbi:MAG TPA: hypothetical protein VGK52_04620 [Polyangia bacterium]